MTAFNRKVALAAAACLVAGASLSPQAQARDFFSSFFGGFLGGRHSAPSVTLPFANESADPEAQPRQPRASGTAYCVRGCDGRYFPINGAGGQSKAETCKSFCPASDTKIVYGSSIDHATTESGKPYSELPNAFRYRNELVAGCTCNGKDAGGLARVNIENDPTMRRGDLVAGPDGLLVANKTSDGRGASLTYSPVSARDVRGQFKKLPVVAAQ